MPLEWIDAGGGTDLGLNTISYSSANIGFPFNFYENTYSSLYVSRYGYLTFNSTYMSNSQSRIPSTILPNDLIAPHMVPSSRVNGYVRYLRGGDAPNRWFAVEWNRFQSECCGSDGAEEYTFEAVLHESGAIVFQYRDMLVNGAYYCQSSGIEDSTGIDGLATSNYCSQIAPNHAVRIIRPGPKARVGVSSRQMGIFAVPGRAAEFRVEVRNTGELGSDTIELTSSANWPVTVHTGDGTPLADTDGDNTPDTGPLAPGATATLQLRMAVPPSALIGQFGSGQVVARSSLDPAKSKIVALQAAVPAPFAESYAQAGRPKAGFYHQTGQTMKELTTGSGNSTASVATMPDGRIVQTWVHGYSNPQGKWVNDLYIAILDRQGNIVRAATGLTDRSGQSINVFDTPSMAVAPSGTIGIVFTEQLYNRDANTYNYNVYLLTLDSSGYPITGLTNLTGNEYWGTSSDQDALRFSYPTVAATPDNRFVVEWERYGYIGGSGQATTWYAVRDASSTEIKPATQFGSNTCSYYQKLTSLADGSVLLSQGGCGNVSYGRLNSSGNVLTGLSTLASGVWPRYVNSAQLPNGNVVLAWTKTNILSTVIQYAVLDGALNVVRNVSTLQNTSPAGDDTVSVTFAGNRAILTWGDTCCGSYPNLYYALLDSVGTVLTPPMIFATDAASGLGLHYNGQGNTFLTRDTSAPSNPAAFGSPTHMQGAWSTNNQIQLTWSGAADLDSGVDGYALVRDSVPTTSIGPERVLDGNSQSWTSPAVPDGGWFYHLRTVDWAGNWATYAVHVGPFWIDATPPESVATSPTDAVGSFPVQWSGADSGSGIATYEVWVRDGAGGTWEKWFGPTTALSTTFTGGVPGHTYYFRSVARDVAGNVETNLPVDGDSQTTAAAAKVEGQVLNNRHEPVYRATVSSYPLSFNVGLSDAAGAVSSAVLGTQRQLHTYCGAVRIWDVAAAFRGGCDCRRRRGGPGVAAPDGCD